MSLCGGDNTTMSEDNKRNTIENMGLEIVAK